MLPKSVEINVPLRESVSITRINEGSISEDTISSRLEPIPPNVLPVSRPASVMKNLPAARRYTARIASPVKPNDAK